MNIGVGLRLFALSAIAIMAAAFDAMAEGMPASALGPQVPIAEASGGFIGSLAVKPSSGPAGTPVTVSGAGLPPGATLDLVWNTSIGKWKVEQAEYHGREYQPVAYRIAAVETDENGGFTADFIVPQDFGFWHDISVQTPERRLIQAGFHVDMTATLVQPSGPAGSPITIDVTGIGRQELQNSWLLLYDNVFTGWISSVTTGGSARFTIPAAGKTGIHVIEVLHGDFTFPYRNMQQSPEPDRPRFVLEYEITEGEAVLPPPPPLQIQADVRSLPEEGDLVSTPRFTAIGEPVTVTGSGFEPGARLELNWTSVTGNRVSGPGWEEYSSVIATTVAEADGKAVFSFETPDDLGGAHGLIVKDGSREVTGAHWIIPSAAALDVTSGSAGTPFTIRLKGVGWTETANIYTITYDNAYIGYACGFNSQGDVEIFLRATGEPGWHFIDLYPAIYKGKEGRPNNFRLPQLTYADDHPGEDLPAFRFAFKVTSQKQASR